MRQRQYRLVVVLGSLTLLTLASAAMARPVHQQRQQADNAQSLMWPFGKPTSQVRQGGNVRPTVANRRDVRPAQPERRLRLHEILQREWSGQPQARQAPQSRQAPRVRQAPQARQHRPRTRPTNASSSRRTRVAARAHHARVEAPSSPSLTGRFKASALVAEARRYLGTNPTRRARLWCARFINLVLGRVGLPGTDSDAAKSFAAYGKRISRPKFGAIAVLRRKGGGHVGIVTGVDRRGNPILIAGNNGRRKVGISVYPKHRVIAYVMPDGSAPNQRRIRQALRLR